MCSDANINPTGLHNLTYILIVHPIAGFVALLAFIFGVLGVAAASRFSTIMMSVMAFFAAVLTLIIFVIDMVLWNLVRKRVESAGGSATLVSSVLHCMLTIRATPTGSPLPLLVPLSSPSAWLFAVHVDDSPVAELPGRRLVHC